MPDPLLPPDLWAALAALLARVKAGDLAAGEIVLHVSSGGLVTALEPRLRIIHRRGEVMLD